MAEGCTSVDGDAGESLIHEDGTIVGLQLQRREREDGSQRRIQNQGQIE